MRLIDADTMNEELFYKQVGGKDSLITAESAFSMVNAQPTAYDVDKVTERLESASFWTRPSVDEDGRCHDDSIEVIDLEEAERIVKDGIAKG